MAGIARRGWSLFLPLSLAVLLLVLVGTSGADTVHKTDGGKIRGTVIEETPDYVKIKAYGSIYKIPRSQIARVDRDGDIRGQFSTKQKRLKDYDEKGWLKFAFWCQDNELHPEAIDAFYKVIRINKNNEEAHWELGHRKLGGKWMPARLYYKAKGYVRHLGMWVTKDDKDKFDMGLVKDGPSGEWVSADEAQKRSAKRRRDASLFGGGLKGGPAQPTAPGGKPLAPKAAPKGRNPFGFGGNPLGRGAAQDKPQSPEERKADVAAQKAKGGWARTRMSKYYDFYSNGPDKEVKTLSSAMDKMCETFKDVFAYKKDIARSFPIYMYGNQQEFMQRTGKGQGVGSYYTSNGQIFSYHSKRAQGTLFHEGTHQFQGLALGRNMWSAKIWFIEGLAVYFEGAKVKRKGIDTSPIPRDRLAHVKRSISSGTYVPLATLLQLEQREFGALHYAHAWSLIHFFVNGTKGGRKRFKNYFKRIKEGEQDNDGKMFEEIFDKPLPVIEKYWLDYVKRLSP